MMMMMVVYILGGDDEGEGDTTNARTLVLPPCRPPCDSPNKRCEIGRKTRLVTLHPPFVVDFARVISDPRSRTFARAETETPHNPDQAKDEMTCQCGSL